MKEYRFKSQATASIEYVGIDEEQGIYWTDYYAGNGGHRPCENVRRKDVRAKIAEAEAAGLVKVPDQHMWRHMRHTGGNRENNIMSAAAEVTRIADGGHDLVKVEDAEGRACTWCADQRRWIG